MNSLSKIVTGLAAAIITALPVAMLLADVPVDLTLYGTGTRSTLNSPNPQIFTPVTNVSPNNFGLNSWAGGNFTFGWNISQSGSLFNYVYTITTPASGKAALSHVIIQISNNATAADFSNGVSIVTFNSNNPSNTLMPANANNPAPYNTVSNNGDLGLKFNGNSGGTNVNIFSFTSDRAPVWGDFYARDGIGVGSTGIAWNIGYGTDPSAGGSFDAWIPRPDGMVGVPEPATLLLLSSVLGAALTAKRRPVKA